MPPQDRVRLNDAGQIEQAWPDPGDPHHQGAITALQPQTVWCTPQGNIELMPKKEVLDFKPAPRPEQVDDKRPKQTEDRKHRRGGCADSASSRESVRMRFLGTTAVGFANFPAALHFSIYSRISLSLRLGSDTAHLGHSWKILPVQTHLPEYRT